MKKLLLTATGLIALFVIGIVCLRGIRVRARSTPEKFDLPPDQLTQLTKRASEQGDANAAFRVYEYYSLSCTYCTAAERQYNVIYYLRIAATNGNAVAQYNLAVNLVLGRDPLKYEEAKFWLAKAAEAGNGDAKKGLDDWDHFVRQWQ
jgi:TPR repeat protein